MGSIGGAARRRLGLLEQSSVRSPCVWCEQHYWTLVAPGDALGVYAKTREGRQVSRMFVDACRILTGRPRGDEVLLPDLEREHEGVLEAWGRVVESRPPRTGCECFPVHQAELSLKARLLYHYPDVARAYVEALEQYAKESLQRNCLYHWGDLKGCVCAPRGKIELEGLH